MKQNLLNRLVMLVVALVMVHSVWGADVVAYTLTPASGTNNSYTGNCDVTINNITWNLTGNSTMQPWRLGGKSITNTYRDIYSKTAISDKITKVEVTNGTNSGSISVGEIRLMVSTSQNGGGTVKSTLTTSYSASSTATFTCPDGVDWSNCYYKISYKITVSGSNNKYVEFSEAKFYKASAVTRTVTWKVNNETYTTGNPTTQVNDGEAVTTLPTAPTTDCGGKTFVGWTATANYTHATNAPGDLFSTAADAPTVSGGNVTYYAVFADASSGGGEEIVETVGFESSEGYAAQSTYNSSSYYTGSNGSKWTINYGAFATSGAIVGSQSAQFRIYKSGGGYGQLYNSVAYAKAITKVMFSAKAANTNGQVKVSYSTNKSSWTDIETKSLTTTTTEYTVTVPVSDVKYIKFTAAGTTPSSGNYSIYVDAVKIYSSGGTSYSNYATSCGPATYTLDLSTSPANIATVTATVGGKSVTEAEKDATVILSYSNVTSGYVFDHWYVLDGGAEEVTVTTNQFTMPASDVSVEGYFKAIPSISVNVDDVSMTVGETDKTLSITASASDGGTLTYTWYQVDSKTTSGGTQVGTGSSYSIPSTLAAGTYYYYCKVTNGAASVTSNCATVTVNSASGYSMHLQNTQDGDKQYFTYGGVGSYSYIDNFVIPEESYCTQFFVGNNGYWYSGNLGNANAKSANWYYGWLPFTTLQDASCGTITLGNATGVIGRLRIDDNSSEDNLHISFDPNGYGFVYGIENQDGWQNIAFARNGETNVWKTASLTLTSEMVAKSYYVGLLKENGGYAHSYRSEGSSKGASLTTTIFGIGVKSGAGNNFDGTISSNTTGVGANTQGCFEIWTDNCNQNFYCHFVPDYNYILKDEDDNVLYASAFVSCEAANKSTTIDNSHNPTKTGYQLMGWSRTKGASGADVTLGGDYSYWKSNDVLYPVWRAIVYTLDNITVKNNPTKTTYNQGEELETTGLTLTAHYTDDISGPGKDEVVTSGFTCSPTTLSTPGASISITVTYQGKTTTFNVKVNAVYNVTFMNNGAQYGEVQHVVAGNTLGTLPVLESSAACDPHSRTFVGWTSATAWEGKKATFNDFVSATTTVNADMTLNAVWAEETVVPSTTYSKITSESNLTEGNYVIAYKYDNHSQFVLKNEANGGYTTQMAGYVWAPTNDQYSNPNAAYIWKITPQNDGSYSIYNASVDKYVNATSGTSGDGTVTLSTTPSYFNFTYIDNINDTRWIVALKDGGDYCFHGYSSDPSYYFKVSTSPKTSNSKNKYRTHLYKQGTQQSTTNYLTTCSSDPQIEVSPASLTGFSTIATTGNPSAAQSFTVEGYNLTEDITISVSNWYEICQTENGTYSEEITLTQSDGKVAKTTLYVRLVASDYATGTGEATGTITIASEGVSPFKEISLSGTVVAAVTVTFNNNGSTDGAPAAIKLAQGGTLGSNLPGVGTMTAPITGYTFVGWVNHTDAWAGFEQTLTQTLITGNEPINADVTYDAVWAKGGNNYKLIDNPTDFTSGNYVIDGYDDGEEEAMNNTLNSSNTIDGAAFPAKDHGVITTSDNSIIWKITVNNNTCALYSVTQNKYLSFTSGEATFSFSTDPVWITASSAVVDNFLEWYLAYNSRYLEYDLGVFDTWSSSNYSTIYLYKQQISNFFVTTPNEYTVTWHKGNAGTATSSAFEGQTFADIAADAPEVANNAAGDCANKFMGWATEAITKDEATESDVQWAKDNTTPISGNVDYYAVFAYKEGSATSYTLTIGTSDVPDSYEAAVKTLAAIDDSDPSNTMDVTLQFEGVMLQQSNIQVRKSGKGTGFIYNITNLGSVTSISAGNLNTYYGSTEHPTSGSTAGTPYFTIGNTSNTETLSEIVIKYTIGSASYSNYVTSCTPPVYTAITLDKGTNGQTDGSATAQQGQTALTNFIHAVGPDHYHLLGYYATDTKVIDAAGALVANVASYTDADGKWLKDDESLTLTAQWEVNSHTLTWAGLDGANITIAGSPAAGMVAWNTPLTAPVATKDGFQLIGWSPEVPATMPDDDATYTALWAPVIVITSQPTDKICYQDDEDVSLAIVATIGEGSLSYQWQSSANGTDGWTNAAGESATAATYLPSTSSIGVTYYRCVVTSNLGLVSTSNVATVTVNQKLSNKYTITYAYKGWGTDPGEQVLEVDGGSTVTLPTLESLGMGQEGYNFIKWEMPDGTQHDPGYEFTMPTENILILAVLEEIQQTVSYTVNGSAAAQLAWTAQPTQVGYWDNDLTAEYTITDGYNVSAAAVTVNDVALADGEIAVDNSTLIIEPSAGKFAGDVSITLTIEPMQYTVYLSALDATNDYTKSVEATFGQEMPAIATLPIRPGYTFQGYFDAETGGTQYYLSTGASAHVWDKSAGATLYAQWSTDSYGITYTETTNLTWAPEGNPANVTIETDMLTANYTVTNGYEVTGMSVTVGGNAVAAGDIDYTQTQVEIRTTFSGAVVITPTVTPKNYTLTFHKNDGATPEETTTQGFYYNQTQNLTPNSFTRTGYLFTGWANTNSSATKAYDDKGEYTYSYTTNKSLYAMWAENPAEWFNVTFIDQMQDNDVANPEQYQHLLTGSEITFPTLDDTADTPPDDSGGGEVQCNEEHYHFVGWVLSTELENLGTTATIHEGGSQASVTANATYYAIWATATIQ